VLRRSEPHLGGVVALVHRANELEAQARLPYPGRRGDQDAARDRLGLTFRERRFEGEELALASDAWRGPPEQGARVLDDFALAAEDQARLVAHDREAHVEEPGGQLIEAHAAGVERAARGKMRKARVLVEHFHRGVDHFAEGEAFGQDAAPARQHHRHVGHGGPNRERAARGPRGLVGGVSLADEGGDERAVGEDLDARAEGLRRVAPGRREVAHALPVLVGEGDGFVVALGRGAHDHAHEAPLAAGELAGAGADARPSRRLRRGAVEGAQGRGDRPRVGGALRAVFGHHARHELLEDRRHLGADLPNARHLVEEDLRQHRHHVVAGERTLPGQALEEDAPEREDVAARVEIAPTFGLLGRHVARRADHDVGGGDRRRLADLRDAEVDHLHAVDATVHEEEVLGLDVAVDDAARVGDAERLGHVAREEDRVRDRDRLARQARLERLAVEPLHRQVRAPVRDAVRHVAHEPGMVELGEDLRLALEALDVARLAPEHDLERDLLSALPIVGAKDGAHAAGREPPFDLEPLGDEVSGPHPIDLTCRRPESQREN
jgi:hypothetical protein